MIKTYSVVWAGGACVRGGLSWDGAWALRASILNRRPGMDVAVSVES